MLTVPVLYEKYDKFIRLARALKELRVSFILTGAGTGVSLLIACVSYHIIPLPPIECDAIQIHCYHLGMD